MSALLPSEHDPLPDGPSLAPLLVPARAWRFQVAAEITNFAPLRRLVGRARAALLAEDVMRRIAEQASWARLRGCGCSIEIEFEGEDPTDLDRALDTIHAACAEPFDLDGEHHRIAVALGAALAAATRADDVRLIEEAEAALARAKVSDGAVTHDLSIDQPRAWRRLAGELGRAIEGGEMLIQYQPKIHVRRQEITSAEALVRWRHPERGLVLPGDFIAAAEHFHVIDRLTLWTIRQVIADQRRLLAEGHDLRIFINISGQLLSDEAFVREACRLVAEADVKLGFEVTETSVIRDPESAIANLQLFADSGVVIAIDDYGAGLSSLAYLKQLPARELKIDKLFVTQLTSSNRDPLIVRSTIDLAHALEMEVVAEGVETHAALALLTVMGCDMVQGFLISRPIALDALITFLAEDAHRAAPQDARASFTRLASAWRQG
jgi:EAL domain-containing protein (putative c-di-GMP-specific phosphodiesterase class I)